MIVNFEAKEEVFRDSRTRVFNRINIQRIKNAISNKIYVHSYSR